MPTNTTVDPILKPWQKKLPTDVSGLESEWQRYSGAQSLAGNETFANFGKGANQAGSRAAYISDLLKKQGIDTSTLSTEALTPEGLPDYEAVRGRAQVLRRLSGRNNYGDASKVNAKVANYEAQQERDRNYKDYTQNTEPVLNNIQKQIDDILSKPAISAQEIADMRSGIVDNVKQSESSRLRRVSAVLGLRGLDPSSPMGAALATKSATDADNELTDSLRKFGLDTTEFNKTSRERELGLAQNLAMSRITARSSALSGDTDRLFAVQNNLSNLVAALDQQRHLEELYAEMNKKPDSSPWMGVAGSVLGGAAGFFLGGPVGASLGSQIGGSIGGAAGNTAAGPSISPALVQLMMKRGQAPAPINPSYQDMSYGGI